MIESTPHPKVSWCNSFFPLTWKRNKTKLCCIYNLNWTLPLKLSFRTEPVVRTHLLTQAWIYFKHESDVWRNEKNKAKFCSLPLFTHLCKVPHFSLLAASSWGRARIVLKSTAALEHLLKLAVPLSGLWSDCSSWFSICEKVACCGKGPVLDVTSDTLKMYLSNILHAKQWSATGLREPPVSVSWGEETLLPPRSSLRSSDI